MALFGLIPDDTKEVNLRLTREDATKEATGRGLMMVGGTLSIIGGMMVFSVNPVIRDQTEGVWQSMPGPIQRNKGLAVVGLGLGIALLSSVSMRRALKRRWEAL